MIIEDATGQAEIENCSRVPDAWSINEGISIEQRRFIEKCTADRITGDRKISAHVYSLLIY